MPRTRSALAFFAAAQLFLAAPALAAASHFPLSELGAKAGTQYHGDELGVSVTDGGARLRCVFQKLEGDVSPAGLWLVSTAGGASSDHFQVIARTVGRAVAKEGANGPEVALPGTGAVEVVDKQARFIRPGMVEEYTVSVDGVQQDFVISERPAGAGDLRVGLEINGARAEATMQGVRLTLECSGRALAYGKLRAVDATGRELAARMEVLSPERLAVRVADASAVYPVRVDPTFSDANWVALNPGFPGTDGGVLAAIVDGGGNLYVGGGFAYAGTVLARGIAKWNGSTWSILGTGTDGYVSALALSGTDLYAAGTFTMAGGVAANNIAKWNGSAWSALGAGIGGAATSLAVSGTNLYVGGQFATVGGNPANNIARWDGTAWSALGAGVVGAGGGSVAALAVSGADLYAGGQFTTAGVVAANNIAKWDGTAWVPLGAGSIGNSTVFSLAVSGTNLYAGGGRFRTAGGDTIKSIAKWDGSAWSALGTGINGVAYALAVSGTDLYVGGNFSTAGGIAASRIAKWDGSAWSALGTGMANDWGLPHDVRALAVSGTVLYAGGAIFTTAGGVGVENVARWDGSAWSALGPGMNGFVQALVVSGTDLYAGGTFTGVGGVTASHIAKWNGSTWSALGTGMNLPMPGASPIYALAVSGTDVYAGGTFTIAGGATANNIAKWDGSAWSALGTGTFGGTILSLAVIGTDLYAGGGFTTAGGVTANSIAKWDGSAWSALGAGITGGDAVVLSLAVIGADLYAAGSFTTAGGLPASNIAKWDGSTWSPLGTGMDNPVEALAAIGTDLYVGGDFTTAGGVAVNSIAKWDGTWSALGAGMTGGSVTGLAASGTDLYAVGDFSAAGGVTANHIARWDGSTWSALGTGIAGPIGQNTVIAVATDTADHLFVGGDFLFAGATLSPFLTEWITAALQSFSPVYGAYGSGVTIGGSGLNAASAVRFNGTPATFTVNSSASITAIVPVGATAGPIEVDFPSMTIVTTDFFYPPGWAVDGVPVNRSLADQVSPASAPADSGGVIVTWQDHRGADYDIYAQRMNAKGQPLWPLNGVALCTATGDQSQPAIASDGAGGAIVTWKDHRGASGAIYAQRVNAVGVVQWAIDGVSVQVLTGTAPEGPAIASDGAGGAIVVLDDKNGAADYGIYAQRVSGSGIVLWPAGGVALCTATGDQILPTIVPDMSGGAIATWMDFRHGPSGNTDIYAQRVNAAGAPQWVADGVAVCTVMKGQVAPLIASDGAGGAIITWGDSRSCVSEQPYAQRLNTAGLPQWTADGVALSSICGRNVNKIAPDAAGGAIVVWETSSNVLAQRVNAGGAPQWTSDGVTLTSVSTVQNPTLVTDGTGGATVAWEDHRSGAYDIYAQHLSSAGAPQWTANGEALCSAGGDQVGPTIVSDAAAGAIVAWQDGRNAAGNSDIYAVRVRSTGFITAVNEVPRPAVAMSLGPIYPNPFNPVVSIQFGLELAGRVRLQIFDTSGRIVRTLFDDKSSAGYRTIRWDGTDEKGRGVASGIYFCRLSGAGGKITRRLALVR